MPLVQYALLNLNTIVSNIASSSGTNRNDQRGANKVNTKSRVELVHDTCIANQILHDSFERECI